MTKQITIEELAQDLCEMDACEADAVLDTAEEAARFPGWQQSNEQRRDHFRAKAREGVASGRYSLSW